MSILYKNARNVGFVLFRKNPILWFTCLHQDCILSNGKYLIIWRNLSKGQKMLTTRILSLISYGAELSVHPDVDMVFFCALQQADKNGHVKVLCALFHEQDHQVWSSSIQNTKMTVRCRNYFAFRKTSLSCAFWDVVCRYVSLSQSL